MSGKAGQELREWWRQALRGAPSLLQLPLDRSRPAQPSFTAGSVSRELPSGLLDSVGALAQQMHINTQAVLLAALQAVLLRYSGQDDVVVGVPVAGRDRPETQGLIGYMINALPVRCTPEDSSTFADLVTQASAHTLQTLEHSALPLEQVLMASGLERIAGDIANPPRACAADASLTQVGGATVTWLRGGGPKLRELV